MKHILATNVNNYVKSKHYIDSVRALFGKSLVGLNHAHSPDGGENWRFQRKLTSRVFTASNFKLLSEQVFHKYATNMVEIINEQGGFCDMHKISCQFTLQVMFDIACGIPVRDVDDRLGLGFIESMDYVDAMMISRIMLKPFFKAFGWFMPSEYKMARHEKVMLDIADKIVRNRMDESSEQLDARSDILSLFIKKAKELEDEGTLNFLDVETLRSVLLTFIFAGRDTTSAAITWTFYALACHPEVQQKIIDELDELNKVVISYDDMKKLKYLDAVVSEAMRLYPTVPFDLKEAAEDDYLPDGTFVPAGTEVLYNTWYMAHNNPIWGSDPLVYRPERWLKMMDRPSAYEFPVFQGGPRICPGMNMALLEIKMFVAVMVRHFNVRIQAGEQVEDRGYRFSTTLVMDGGLPLHMTPRGRTK